MNISGKYRLRSDPRRVWEALEDPQVLVDALPGVRRLEVLGPDRYTITADVGVGAVRGTYDGEFVVVDKQPPESVVLRGSARGVPGSLAVEARVRLSPDDGGGTLLDWEAETTVSGPIAGVGQRMIAAAARRTTEEFLGAVDRAVLAPEGSRGSGGGTAGPGPAVAGQVFTRQAAPTDAATRAFAAGVVVGALIALAGVVVGRSTRRSR